VQGVGFRYFALNCARDLALTGWVRNCSNGEVECEAQGPEPRLREFLGRLESGPPGARTDGVASDVLPEKINEKGFEITD
jgi:acylphosphatase